MGENTLDVKTPIPVEQGIGKLQPLLSSTFYSVLDNFEPDQTYFTTDDELECSDNAKLWDGDKFIKLAEVFQSRVQS